MEVLIQAIRLWGNAVFSKLEVMYDFDFHGVAKGETLLGGDPFGESLLYFTETPYYFAFASELIALRKLLGFDSTINTAAVYFSKHFELPCLKALVPRMSGPWQTVSFREPHVRGCPRKSSVGG